MWTFLIGGLITSAGFIAFKVLASLGVAFVTYQFVDVALTTLKSEVTTRLTGLPADTVAVLSLSGVGEAIAIVLAAITVRVTLDLVNGSLRKLSLIPS